MKVLMISGDKNILTSGSDAHARLELQKGQVEQLDVFVWPQIHSIRLIRKAIRSQQYDVITAQDPFWRGHLAWLLSRRTHMKLNIQVHTDLAAEPWWRRKWGYFQLRQAASIRVVSEKLKQEIAPYVSAPISVVPVYVDITRFSKLEHQSHLEYKKTILWMGRFEKEKDPLYALKVLQEVRDKGVDAKLVMLGAGTLESLLQESADTLTTEFPGWQDPTLYMQAADVVLCTSKSEGYGVSIVESLAAGIPVVAPDVGIAREAGAIVVPRPKLSSAILRVFGSGEKGVLKLSVPSAAEWARAWKETLA